MKVIRYDPMTVLLTVFRSAELASGYNVSAPLRSLLIRADV